MEAVFSLLLLLLALCFEMELVRRSVLSVLLHHSAFIYVRDRALGVSARESREEVKRSLQASLGSTQMVRLEKRLDYYEKRTVDGLKVGIHYRYPMLLPFRLGKTMRHHLEITEQCFFPF